MKTTCDKLKQSLKNDLCLEDKMFKDIMWQCAVLGTLLFLSIFWMPLVFVTLIVAGLFICLQKNGYQLYFLVFLLPLISIFRRTPTDMYFLAYLTALVIAFLGIKFVISVIKKQQKINWAFSATLFGFILFILIFADYSGLSVIFSLILGLLLIYITFIYKKDLNFKKISLLFIFGLLFSILIGLFNPAIQRLNDFSMLFYEYGKIRFAGASSNPNILGGEIALGLACILALFVNKEFKIIFWPVFTIMTITIIFIISKATLLIYITILIAFMVIYLIKNHKKSDMWIIISIALLTAIIALIFNARLSCLLERFSSTLETRPSNDLTNSKTKINMQALSTGRIELWKQYLEESFSSIKYAIVGHGVGTPFMGAYGSNVGFGPHNTLLQCLYYTGMIGYLFIIALILIAFDFKKIKQIKIHNIITFLSLFLYLFAIEFFSYRLSIYLIITLPALFYTPVNTHKLEQKNKE